MGFFKPRTKVHLSPRLARTIGKPTIPNSYYLGQIALVLVLGAIVTYMFLGSSGPQRSASQAKEANGEVLGVQASNVINYQVVPGDSLLGISQKFGVYWETIVAENELKAPYNLKAGDILRIPLPRN